MALSTGIGDGTTGTTTEVEITSPVEIKSPIEVSGKITSETTILSPLPRQKWENRDHYMLDMAAKLYCNMNSGNAQEARENSEKAIKYAMIFWNAATGWYADELVYEGGNTEKYTFSSYDKPTKK